MDPNAALQNARDEAAEYVKQSTRGNMSSADDAAGACIGAFNALDGWLSIGGFPPAAWKAKVGTRVDGVAYTPEAVAGVRQLVIDLRDSSLAASRFDVAVGLSHVIAYLAEYEEVINR